MRCSCDDDDNDTSRPYCYASPDIISYNIMLHVYASRGDAENAQALLRLMEENGSNNSAASRSASSSSSGSADSQSSSSSMSQHKLPNIKHSNILQPKSSNK